MKTPDWHPAVVGGTLYGMNCWTCGSYCTSEADRESIERDCTRCPAQNTRERPSQSPQASVRHLAPSGPAALGKERMSFDPACRDLAEHFLDRGNGIEEEVTDADRDQLAQAIQDAVEFWFAGGTHE